MSDQKVQQKINTEVQSKSLPQRQARSQNKPRGKRGDSRANTRKVEKDPFEHKIIEINRVTKMFKGGRRMKISVFVAVGDKKGRVGLGLGKGDDVKAAQDKAIAQAKKNLVFVNLKGNTIPHEVLSKFKAGKVLLKPAAPGTGIVAGSSVRQIVEVAGVSDVLGKILGSNNKITNSYATVKALTMLRSGRL